MLGGEALGPDPVLNEYAQSCIEGDLQACDDLMYESAPLSAYEDYAITCGGRVKVYAVVACIDLDEAPAARPTGAESGAPVRRFRRW